MSRQCLAHASSIYAACMNDPPVAARSWTGNQETRELSQALGSTSWAAQETGRHKAGIERVEATDVLWRGPKKNECFCVWD